MFEDPEATVRISAYPATTRQFWFFFQALPGSIPFGIYPPNDPEHTAEPICRCMHRQDAHEHHSKNKWQPCMYRHCPCWRFRLLEEPKEAPFLPGMEIVNHATPMRLVSHETKES